MKTAENKPNPRESREAEKLASLRASIAKRDWRGAGELADELRFGYGWRYARFAAEFGAEAWEEAAQEIDAAESEDE